MIRVLNIPPLLVPGGLLAFKAQDNAGVFELWVPLTLWEQLESEAPLPNISEDRRDYALSMIEATAADIVPTTAPSGLRVAML